jgi:predicted DNA-binding protein YlxM (UPF0122 family)
VTFGSLFAGIGGFDLGFERAGMTCRWQVEIDPWCRQVLAKHWPDVPKYEDVILLRGGEVPGTLKKLTQEQVSEAIRLYEGGLSLSEVATFFGVSRQSMWDLLRRRIELRPQLRFGDDNHFYRGGEVQDDRAQNVLEKAVARGAVVPAEACENCGSTPEPFVDGRRAIQAHHDDYNKPLDVRWLCQRCHHEWHQEHRAVPRLEVPVEPVDVLVGGFPSRVKTSASPAAVKDSRVPGQGSGPNMRESFASYDPATSSWRTSQLCLDGASAVFSETWPRAGMTRNGTACQREPLAPITRETASGSWPTPLARDGKHNGSRVQWWRDGNGGLDLTSAVQMWPTPTARDHKDGRYCPNVPINGLLGRAVWATPTVNGNYNRKGSSLTSGDGLATQAGGALNPRWVEWLMGYPDGWTDLGDSATPSSRRSRSGSENG